MKRWTNTFAALLLGGCAAPVSWEARITHPPSPPVSLAYNDTGRGETLLFLHGFGESRYTWDAVIKALAKDYRCVAPDLKGFGFSPTPDDGRYSVYDQAVAVRALMDDAALDEVTLIAHSYGGGVALVLALMPETASRIRRIVLIDSMAYPQKLPSMMRLLALPIIGPLAIHLVPEQYQAKKAYGYAFYDDTRIPPQNIATTARLLTLPGAKRAYLATVRDLIPEDLAQITPRYRDITQPVLLIWGERDGIVKPSIARQLHATLPDSHLRLIPNCGHMPQEERPEAVVQAVRTFMRPASTARDGSPE